MNVGSRWQYSPYISAHRLWNRSGHEGHDQGDRLMKSIQTNLALLESSLPELQRQRNTAPFANDVYEAIDDWCHFGRHAVENDTRVNYPIGARAELELLAKLGEILQTKSSLEQERYGPLFETASDMLKQLEMIPLPHEGHLGTLKVIRKLFEFLRAEYGFGIADEQPMGMRFSSGAVFLKLEYSKNPVLSCSFGTDLRDGKEFGLDDLLFLYGDRRYRELPQSLTLGSETEVESWFQFIADVFKQFGREVLSNQPGVFDRLAQAQAQRDAQYVEAMNQKYGKFQ
jgi:hypothetical protein